MRRPWRNALAAGLVLAAGVAWAQSYLPVPSGFASAKGALVVTQDANNLTSVAAGTTAQELIGGGAGELPTWAPRGRAEFTVCGDATTVNNNTVYYGPDMTVVSSATVGQLKCDTTAAGNTTEATADTPAFTAKAFYVLGMRCNHPDSNATLTFTARSAAAALTPTVVVTTADNETQGMTSAPSTTAIASGATFAVAVASTSDIGTVPFICTVDVAY